MGNDGLRDELLQIENEGWQSLCDATGDAFYGDVMTDDALMVLANGAIMDRTAVGEALGQAPPWKSYEISDVRLVKAGEDVAALIYIGKAFRDGQDTPFTGAMSSVYHRVADRWRLVLYQQTAVSG